MELLEIKKDFYWCGLINKDLKVFDIVMLTEYGTSFNSYILKTTEGIILFENVKMYKQKNKTPSFDAYIKKLLQVTDDLRNIKYIVMNHTEPDHSGSIKDLIKLCNRNCKVISTSTAASYLREIFNMDIPIIEVKEGMKITLGNKTLSFYDIPMLHWPDSMFTLIEEDKIVLSCDVLGAHYAFNALLFSKMNKNVFETDYTKAFDHYFNTIMSPFKPFVLMAMDKMRKLFEEDKIHIVAPGHGIILDDKKAIDWAIKKYKNFSTIDNPYKKPLLVFAVCSAYGYTKEIADLMIKNIENKYKDEFIIKLHVFDVENFKSKKGEILKDVSFCKGFFVGCPTIANDANPLVWDLLSEIPPLESNSKFAASFGSFGWSGESVPNLTQRLSQLKFRTVKGLEIKFRLSEFDKNRIEEYVEKTISFIKTRKTDKEFIYRNKLKSETVWK